MDNKNNELTISVSGMNEAAEKIIRDAQIKVASERSKEREKTYRAYRNAFRSHEENEQKVMRNAYRLMNNMSIADLTEAFFGHRAANRYRAEMMAVNIFSLWYKQRMKAKSWIRSQVKKLDGYLDFVKKKK